MHMGRARIGNLETIGPAIVRWSSKPSPRQRAAVAACVTG
jgi:hypothetical protein